MLVRVTDTGGNIVDQGPYPVFAVTPSDRGAPNGSGATEAATFDMSWTVGGKSRRTLRYGTRAGIRGKLLNSNGQPIAGAKVVLLTRDLRRDAAVVPRTTIVTGSDGTFRTTVTATASRLLQFAWLSHANDVRPGANGYLTLQARADAQLTVSTRRPRVGRSFTVSGRLRGVSRGGVPVIVQGRARRLEALRDVRGHDDLEQRPLQGHLPLPQFGLARAQLRLPRADPPRGPLPLRDGLFAAL